MTMRPEVDEKTGWPLKPEHPCPKGDKVCFLKLTAGPIVCCYKPQECPFYGRMPDTSKNVPEKKNPEQMSFREENN
ncbi:MAG: hypothetical protein Q8O55_08695 [Dehalococcoidales bacterium]|nr:hypothetical protein [Dehalococcoidales bacterium]